MISKEKLVRHKKEKILTYFAPSTVCDGVGIFAYINIPKDTIIFPSNQSNINEKREWSTVTKKAAKKIKSLTLWDEEGFYTDCNINRFDIAYYVNHSRKPNVHYERSTDTLYAMHKIKKGTELLQFYLPEERGW
tara:strand:- start:299 stop:700 length:402 start_codon:yes stop_codon:yes gene_type:complete